MFDEIEKAHPDVFNILLQVLDDGRLTDNKGRVVNFKNTIIIMTSNMGSSYIQSQMEKLHGSNKEEVIEETKKEVMNMLKKTIRPEFLNRIDETIMFLPLNEKEIKQIVLLQIKGVQKMLAENGVELQLTEGALNFLSQVGYDPEFGARPVKRAIQRYLLNDLSKKLLSQEVDRSKVKVIAPDGSFAETPSSKDSYETTDMNEKIEKADYKLGEDGNVIEFLHLNKDKNIRVEYMGDRTYKTTMSPTDRLAAANVYELAQILSAMEQIKKEQEEANLKIGFINKKKERKAQEEITD